MNSYKLLLGSFFLLLAAGIFSCKKKKNDNPFGSARIATIVKSHTGSILNYRIFYSPTYNVDSILYTGSGTSVGSSGYLKFSYFGSSYSITDQANFTYTVLANTSGMILKVLVADTMGFIYNGTLLGAIDVYARKTTYPYYTITRTNYYWTNGDISTVITNGVTKAYEYDNTRNGQPGDAIRIDQFLTFGRSYTKTTRLPREIKIDGTWTEQYYYEFDGSGRISQLIKVKNNNGVSVDDSTFYSYTYY